MSTQQPRRERVLAATACVALAALTGAVAVGLGRLVVDTSLMGPTLLAAAVAHTVAWGARRLGLNATTGLLLTVAAGAETIVLSRYGASATAGLPTGDVLGAIGGDLREAWQVFGDEGAPAPVVDGFVTAAMAAVIVIAAAADTLAFRVGAPVEAVAPAAGLFVFTTVLGGPDHQVTATLLFVAALLGFLLLHRVARQSGQRNWLGASGGTGTSALLRSGAGLAVVGVMAGLVVGPALPGSAAAPLIDLDDDGSGTRVTINPLVEIQARLVDQADVEVFTVRSDERAYWRLTALDRFDGAVWSAGGDYVGADGPLEGAAPAGVDTGRTINQHVEILALGAVWLPAAFEPVAIQAETAGVQWNAASSSLVVDDSTETVDALAYDVVSNATLIDHNRAVAAEEVGPAFDHLRRLPEDFSASARRTAEQITSEAPTPYDRALALQTFFREQFEYSLDIAAGHGIDDIDDFLDRKIGYCEQFAGTYAALARSLGLPARVAVGFTPGDVDPDDPQLFHVRGEHAHAWPEVYLGGLGWVAFEPTPGRGAPNSEGYTGVAEQQHGEQAPGVPTTPTTSGASTTTTPAGQGVATGPDQTDTIAADATGTTSTGPTWPVVVLAGAGALALSWISVVPLVSALRKRRSLRRSRGRPSAQVDLAWSAATSSLARMGVRRRPAETPRAFGRRADDALAGRTSRSGPVGRLADSVTALWYGGGAQINPAAGREALDAAATITAGARRRSGRRRWFVSGLDPRHR